MSKCNYNLILQTFMEFVSVFEYILWLNTLNQNWEIKSKARAIQTLRRFKAENYDCLCY